MNRSFSSIIIPKYFIIFTRSNSIPCTHFNTIFPFISFLTLLAIIYLVFYAFIFNLFLFIQFSTILRDILKLRSYSTLLSPLTYINSSLANIFIVHLSGHTLTILFIYIMNNKRPNTDPCGTPYTVLIVLDHSSLNRTCCALFFKYDRNYCKAFPLIPYWYNLSSNISLFTVSEARFKSMKIIPIILPSLMSNFHSSITV